MSENDTYTGGSERLENVTIDKKNSQIVINGVAVELTGKEGEPLEIDHVGTQDGYIAFLEAGENGGVKPGGEAATVFLTEPDDRSLSTGNDQ